MDLNHKIDKILHEIREIEKYTLDFRNTGYISKEEMENLKKRVRDLYSELKRIRRNYAYSNSYPDKKIPFHHQETDKKETADVEQQKEKARDQQKKRTTKPFEDKKELRIRDEVHPAEKTKTLAIPKSHQLKKHLKTSLSSARIWLIIIMLFAGLVAYTGYNTYQGKYGDLPDTQTLKNIRQSLATEIYTNDGQLMGRYYLENRNSIHFEHIPAEIIHAILATEDTRYFEHHGIDTRSIFRVMFRTILLGDESSGGGSTLTQQLAKNLYPRRGDSHIALIGSKIREMIIAWRLENLYSKERLLQMYLNTVPFGEYTFGIKNASQLYFNKLPSELSLEQACTLIGMLKGTSNYNPRKNPEKAKERRNVVLSQLAKYDYLSQDTTQKLMDRPLGVNYNPLGHNEGLAPYLREYLRPRLKEWCKSHTKTNGEPYNLYTDGLKVYTTIDGQLQEYAEKAVSKHMPGLQKMFDRQLNTEKNQTVQSMVREILAGIPAYKDESVLNRESSLYEEKSMEIFTWDGLKRVKMSPVDSVKHYLSMLNAGFMAMNPHNSHILAWVGGIDHRFFKYDHVTSRRQVGSTFKPIVYANALQNGAKPCHYYPNDSIVYENYDNWSPNNANREYGGIYSLQGALVNSVNTVSVQLLMKAGIDSTIQLAKNMGINSDFQKVPSLGLGTVSASVREMAEAYTGFANDGKPLKGKLLLRIENSKGKVLETFNSKNNTPQVLDEKTAEKITMMLQNVVKKGTARSLSRNFDFSGDVAGKTGTTQDQADGWFAGYTPHLVFASWVGAEYPSVHFNNLMYGQGAATALPIAGYFLNNLYNEDPRSKYFGNFRYHRIDTSEYACQGYIEEEEKDEMEQKIHYLRRSPGLAGRWFGTSDFDETKEKVTLRDMDEDWGSEHHGHEDWAIAWKGAIEAPYSGRVRFQAESSGKVKMWIDDKLILSGRGRSSGTISMNKGRKYPITLTHAQSGEGAHLRVYWKWPEQNQTIIPGDVLFHNQQDYKSV
ncbi:MAG: transglycosylase domain-containing protein, partial [Bacteroidota bacterium]